MITIRHERTADFDAREALLDCAFGEARTMKTSERLREGRLPTNGLSFVATDEGQVIGTARLWDIAAGPGRSALLLGPLAVDPGWQKLGVGKALMKRALQAARRRGHRAVLLVGDAPYYGRFGFTAAKTGELWMPGAYERHRLLGLELMPGALDGARGLIGATGQTQPKPELRVLIARHTGRLSHAA
ncbi:MAG: family N-acetyltransferase [Xanthobacteraceae bacterium]|jgi:predicted N-acetyltransferase YhbS|nr:family N-acetyltransferase [Xanthobacteraceae bacterium]